MGELRLDVATSRDEVLEVHGLVSGALVDDRRFVSGLVDGNGGVDLQNDLVSASATRVQVVTTA